MEVLAMQRDSCPVLAVVVRDRGIGQEIWGDGLLCLAVLIMEFNYGVLVVDVADWFENMVKGSVQCPKTQMQRPIYLIQKKKRVN